MAQYRTSADYVDAILNRAGETANGNSDYEADALDALNKVHQAVISGGNIFDMDVNDTWVWAKSKRPMVLELQPKIIDGSISLALGSEVGTFSVAPTSSLAGWFIKVIGDKETYRVASHAANSTAFELDGAYVGTTNAAATYETYKLDYELVPSYLIVSSTNNSLDFAQTSGTVTTNFTATLTAGSYTPAQLATHVATQLGAAGTATYSGAYSTDTTKFTLTASGGKTFGFLGASGTSSQTSALPLLGFDDADLTAAAAQTSVYVLGGIARLVEPFRRYQIWDARITSVDNITMAESYPLTDVRMGLPTRFTKMSEDKDGRIVVRFNKYPEAKTRIEIEHVPVPRDLFDNALSIPLVPRKNQDILVYGAAAYLLIDKDDSKAATYMSIAQKELQAMMKNNRSELFKSGRNFGEIVPRKDLVGGILIRRRYGYTADDR